MKYQSDDFYKFHPFQLESYLAKHEQNVTFNYSESGVHPLRLGDLLELADIEIETLGDTVMDYPEVNGKIELRRKIAALYPEANEDNVLVTIGASEANHLVAATLLGDGDEVVTLQPSYLQLSGNALNRGIKVNFVKLVEKDNWSLDISDLNNKVTSSTRLISIINPHNPTGHILTKEEIDAVIAAADKVGAWIISDEVYAGTERDGRDPTPTLWNRYERVIAINSMSKAYGLPGLRIGWLIAPKAKIAELTLRHEYATISATMLGNDIANIALSDEVRPKLTQRARQLINTGFDILMQELEPHKNVYSVVPPEASAMCVVRYDLPIDSLTFADRLVTDKSTLVVPGSCFGLDQHFRCSSALPEVYLKQGIAKINELVSEVLQE